MIKMPDGDHSLTLFFNPIWKALARYLTYKCEKCGQERLLSVFEGHSSGLLCESYLLTLKAITPLIRLLFFSLRVDVTKENDYWETPLSINAFLTWLRELRISE